MSNLINRIRYELAMLEADIPVQKEAMRKAHEQYDRDWDWDRESADRGYLDSLYKYQFATEEQIKLLKRLLKDD